MPSYDLHLHTHYSYDATASVEEMFAGARRQGLTCIAITEHFNIDSMPEALRVARSYPDIRYIPSAELSVNASIGGVDLLFYGLPPSPTEELKEVLAEYVEWQRGFNRAVIDGLRKLGHEYRKEELQMLLESYRPEHVRALQGETRVANSVQRKYFIERGFIKADEEYWDLLERAHKVCPRPPYPDAQKVVQAAKRAGALAVIAHPRNYMGSDEKRIAALCDELQLDGIECAHPSVPLELTAVYRKYCVEHGLISTAGSDSHSPPHLETLLGKHAGEEEWLKNILARLP